MKLEWSVWAHADRDAIFDSIEKDNPRAAVGVDKRIGDLVKPNFDSLAAATA